MAVVISNKLRVSQVTVSVHLLDTPPLTSLMIQLDRFIASLVSAEMSHDNLYDDYFYTVNGRITCDLENIPEDAVIRKHFRIRGGKGGFGSMLRAIGSQIEKTTNHEMCRDLSGRRMRDVNTERKLKEWYANASEREREKMEKYYERRQNRREMLAKGPLPDHKFSDREYERQKRKITYELQGALDAAIGNILKNKSSFESSVPSTSASEGTVPKRARLWIEELDGYLSSSSSSGSGDGVHEDDPVGGDPDSFRPVSPGDPTDNALVITNPVKSDSDAVTEKQMTSTDPNSTIATEPPISIPNPESGSVSRQPTVQPLSDSDLEAISDAASLESLGLEVLKESLSSRGLKCGGTLSERARRLFSVRGLPPEEYPAKLRAKLK
ncbi:hypothetical protein EG68_07065 [Paragonimus skrjabini miyazakii]|uniref:Replication stress response regulator SDE2 n=1 Tax=Paragonimus skrjabini miyazakii TaxID=59628 RepID=A0A8S9YA76_9TREM|nr:hypothetical protein EG68_07065 [Paragonimus skrjabini miyazakii]